MNNENNSTPFSLKLYHIDRKGEILYRMQEYSENQMIREIETPELQKCLDYFMLSSDHLYFISWMGIIRE